MKYVFVQLLAIGGLLVGAAPPPHSQGGEVVAARAAPALELRQASTHPLRYYLSLPEGYERHPGKKWPVLFVLIGRGTRFQETAEAFREARGNSPVVIVVPVTFANNWIIADEDLPVYRRYYDEKDSPDRQDLWHWDETGLLAILKDLQASADVEERIYMNGFSAGGLLTYHFIFTRPELLKGVVLVCANFIDVGYRDMPRNIPSQALALPIVRITGGDDPLRYVSARPMRNKVRYLLIGTGLAVVLGLLVYRRTRKRKLALSVVAIGGLATALVIWATTRNQGSDAQNQAADKLLQEFGYTNVERTLIPAMGHEPREDLVLEAWRRQWER